MMSSVGSSVSFSSDLSSSSSSSNGVPVQIKENPVTDAELALLPKFKESILKVVDEYLASGSVKSLKLPKVAHFRTVWNESYRTDPIRPNEPLPYHYDGAVRVAADVEYLPGPPIDLSSWQWVKNGLPADRLYLRFLRARAHDIPAATFMFIEYIHWWHAFGVSELIRVRPMPFVDRMDNVLEHTFHGYDKSGRPIYIQRSGAIDAAVMCNILTPQQAAVCQCWSNAQYEAQMEKESRKRGYRVDRMCLIFDLKGLSLSQRSLLSFFRATSYIDQHYWPEFLGASYFINAPKIFSVFWTIIKRFLHPVTQAKFKVLSSDYSTVLCAELGEESVPKEMGGKCVCNKSTNTCIHKKTTVDLKGINERQGKLGVADGLSEEEAALIKPLKEINEEKWQTIHIKAAAKEIIEFHIKPSTALINSAGISPVSDEKSETSPSPSPSSSPSPVPSFGSVCAGWWYIQCTVKDIDFSADFLPADAKDSDDLEPVMEKKRITACAASDRNDAASFVRGVFVLPEENVNGGKVRLTFDNSYSRFTSKTVRIVYDTVEKIPNFKN